MLPWRRTPPAAEKGWQHPYWPIAGLQVVLFYRNPLFPRQLREPKGSSGVDAGFDDDLGGNQKRKRVRAMWISLFTVACGIAVCLSVAAVVMQPATRRTLRG
jgi:hypothetical protein